MGINFYNQFKEETQGEINVVTTLGFGPGDRWILNPGDQKDQVNKKKLNPHHVQKKVAEKADEKTGKNDKKKRARKPVCKKNSGKKKGNKRPRKESGRKKRKTAEGRTEKKEKKRKNGKRKRPDVKKEKHRRPRAIRLLAIWIDRGCTTLRAQPAKFFLLPHGRNRGRKMW